MTANTTTSEAVYPLARLVIRQRRLEMRSFYKPATDIEQGECLNLMPTKDGATKYIEATKNAVIMQLFVSYNDDGERVLNRAVCIECIDDELYPDLKDEAMRILSV